VLIDDIPVVYFVIWRVVACYSGILPGLLMPKIVIKSVFPAQLVSLSVIAWSYANVITGTLISGIHLFGFILLIL